MNKTTIITIISGVAVIIVLAIIWFSMSVSYQNKEARYVNQFKAENQKIEATYDNMWKEIQQIAEVTDNYKESFKEIYVQITDARYDKDNGVLMKWITESNPQFDVSQYEKLSNVIEVERKRFLNAQTKIIDIVREHNNMLDVIPSKWFLSGKEYLEYEVISSSITKDVMRTRLDEDVHVFMRKNNEE